MKLSDLIKELQELAQFGSDYEITIYGHNGEELIVEEMGTQVGTEDSSYGYFLDLKNKG